MRSPLYRYLIRGMIPFLLLFYVGVRLPLLQSHVLGDDEIRDLEIVQAALQNDSMVYYGARFTHKGHLPSPIYYNLLTWGYQLTGSIEGMRLMVLIFNTLGVALLLYFLRGLFSLRFIALYGVFIAVSPWLVKYGSFSWNPNYLPFVSAVYLISGYKVLTSEKSFWIFPALLILFFGISMHVFTLPYVVVFGIMLLLSRKIHWGYLFLAILVIVSFLAIYLYYDYRNGWWNTQLLFLPEDKRPYKWESFKVLQYLFLMTTAEMSFFIKRGFTYNLQYWYPPLYQAVLYLLVLVGSVVITLAAHYRFCGEEWQRIRSLGWREYLKQYPFNAFIILNVLSLILFAVVLGRGFEPRYGLIATYFLIWIVIRFVEGSLEKISQKSQKLYYISLLLWILSMGYHLYLSWRISFPHPLNLIFY